MKHRAVQLVMVSPISRNVSRMWTFAVDAVWPDLPIDKQNARWT